MQRLAIAPSFRHHPTHFEVPDTAYTAERMRWHPSRPGFSTLQGAHLAPRKGCIGRTLYCFQQPRSSDARGRALNWLGWSTGARDAPLAAPGGGRARGVLPHPTLPLQRHTAPLRSTAIAWSFRHRPTHFRVPDTSYTAQRMWWRPSPPGFPTFLNVSLAPRPNASDGTTAASSTRGPLPPQDLPKICWQGVWGSLGASRVGGGACLRPPASPLARPLRNTDGSEVGIGALQVISHESAVALSGLGFWFRASGLKFALQS